MKNEKEIRNKIIQWGKENTDDFPWRHTQSLYQIVLAEIMLIRTSAEQVLPVYKKFIKEYPTPQDLENLEIEEIKSIIKSIGLPWRAKTIKEMSDFLIKNEIKHEDPDESDLMKIPGVGEYSSSAILVFFYEKRAIPVDTNTVRFVERISGEEFSGESRRNDKLKGYLDGLIPAEERRSVKFNISLIDFMRKICTSKNPGCNNCSISNLCYYYLNSRKSRDNTIN